MTSIDADGTREGYDLELTAAIVDAVDVPVIASGGAGEARHLAEAFEVGAEAALVASIVHERPGAGAGAEGGAEGGGMERPDLTPAIVQDAGRTRVLMLAWMDEEALRPHPRDRGSLVLEPVARDLLAQGRDVRQHARGRRAPRRLRR